MKIATFDAGAGAQLGAVTGDRITPLHQAAPGLPADMIGLISAWRPRSGGPARSWRSG